MPGPMPTGRPRQRQRPPSSAAKLDAGDPFATVPKLPWLPNWHAQTKTWWVDVWRSPMRTEFTDVDYHALVQLAVVVNDFWTCETAKDRIVAMAEIRLQGQRFGLSPIDRWRLKWEVDRGDEAQNRTAKRREAVTPAPAAVPPPAADGDDGLGALRMVK